MKRTSQVISTVAALLLAASLAAPAQAVPLLAKSPNPNAGGFPVWVQGQDSLALQGCLDGTLGPLGTDRPRCFLPNQPPAPIEQIGFDPVAPKVFPGNWPDENMYYLATTADMTLAGGQIANVEFAVEATIDPALGNPMFHRIRMIFLPNTATGAGTYTIVHPWGTTVFTQGIQSNPFGDAVNDAARGRATADVNVGLPTDLLAGILTPYAGIMGDDPLFAMSHFPASVPVPPAINPPGFLGDCDSFLPLAAGPNGNTVKILGPDGAIIAQTNLFRLCAQKFGMEIIPPAVGTDFGEVGPVTVAVKKTKTFTLNNLTGAPVTPVITAIVSNSNPPVASPDFTVVASTPAATACDLTGVTPLAIGATCKFDVIFSPTPTLTAANEARTSTIAITAAGDVPTARTTVTGTADFTPPATTLAAPFARVSTTKPSVISGTVEALATVSVNALPATVTPVPSTATDTNTKWSFAFPTPLAAGANPAITLVATDAAGNMTTLNPVITGIVPDGIIAPNATAVSIADAQLALRFASGLSVPTPEQNIHADVAPLVNGVPTPNDKLDIGDVVLILRKVVAPNSWTAQ